MMMIFYYVNLNYPGLPSGVLGYPRISVGDGDGDGVGFGFGVGDRGLGTSQDCRWQSQITLTQMLKTEISLVYGLF